MRFNCSTAAGLADALATTAPPSTLEAEFPTKSAFIKEYARTLGYEKGEPRAEPRPEDAGAFIARVCAPFALMRLSPDARRVALTYVLEVAEGHALRRIEHGPQPPESDEARQPRSVQLVEGRLALRPRPLLGRSPWSAAACFETCLHHATSTRAVCTAVRADIDALMQRPGSTANGRAWLEHLYLRRDDSLNATQVMAELTARAVAGARANLTREIYKRADDAFAKRLVAFRPPSAWTDGRKEFATIAVQEAKMSVAEHPREHGFLHISDGSINTGLGLAHGYLLTADETNGCGPCDLELLKLLACTSVESMIASLSGKRVTVALTSATLKLFRENHGQPPDDEALAALEGALDALFGAERGERWATAWCNNITTPYEDAPEGVGDFFHDSTRPPLTLREALRREPSRLQLTLDRPGRACCARIDLDIPANVLSQARHYPDGFTISARDRFVGPRRSMGPLSVKCHTGRARFDGVSLSLDTSLAFSDRNPSLSRADMSIGITEQYYVNMDCWIPGLN